MPTTPTPRHYLLWIAACALAPVALAQCGEFFAGVDFQPRYLLAMSRDWHNALVVGATIALCLAPPLLQWRALRGIAPALRFWPWLALSWGAIVVHTALFLATSRHLHVQIGGRELAELLTMPGYSIARAVTPLRLAASLIASAGLTTLFQAVLPALLLARQAAARRCIILAALAGSVAALLAQWLQAASGTCLFVSPAELGMQADGPFAIVLLARAAVGAVEGAAGVLALVWLMRRCGAALSLRWPLWLLLTVVLLNLPLQPVLSILAHGMGLNDMPC